MRVLILGPVVNETTSGGVAVFDEGLYGGFRQLGDEVNILSIGKSQAIENIVLRIWKPKPLKILFHLRKAAKLIRLFKPDIVISSLHYSLGIKKYKRYWPAAKYIHILHGTPCPINGRLKAWCVNCAARYAKKHFDKLVTVSHLSWAINKKINRVECDAIINTGCSCAPTTDWSASRKKDYDFCYVGRLYRDKNIEKMMDAMVALRGVKKDLKVCIAGFGEQECFFQKGGKYDLDFVDFLGRVNHDEVSRIYASSKFFISLCELEACGLAFSEAAINGCNPIASLSSGQSQFFVGKEYYHVADASNVDALVNDLRNIMNNYVEICQDEIDNLATLFSYKTIAGKYKALIQ